MNSEHQFYLLIAYVRTIREVRNVLPNPRQTYLSPMIEEHSECKDFKSIKKIAKNIQGFESFNEVRRSLEDIDTNIDKMIQEIQSNHKSTQDYPRMILQQICEIREKVNMHLNMLEKRLNGELFELTNKAENDMQLTIKSLEKTKLQNARKQE